MSGMRVERVAEEIRRELAAILTQRARDPRLTWIGVHRVEVSKDLSHARVYVSALGDEATQEESLRVLVRAAPYLRTELGHALKLRKTPELHFRADLGLQASERVREILLELGLLEPGQPRTAEDEA